jgi:proteasome lid subunit RPN8/RPN11
MKDENRVKFLAHARLMAPREACGVLIVDGGKEQLIICKNISEYDQQFIIDPFDYVAAADRGDVIAIVHSHPLSSPLPSEADLVSCEQTQVPWHIVGVITGEWHSIEPKGYKAPLIGRTWCHGVLDCYSLIRDYYRDELNIELVDYDREFEWWIKGEDLYIRHFEGAGFVDIGMGSMKKHDVILMQIQSGVANHGGIFLGGDRFLHHLHKRLSSRDVYGGYWLKNTVKVVRHRSLV